MFNLILAILAPLLTMAGGITMPQNTTSSTVPVKNFWQSACYQIEPKVKLTISKNDLDKVHSQFPAQPSCDNLVSDYTLIRRDISLVPFKVEDEGGPLNGGCDLKSAIRWVGEKNDGKKIYWEDSNFRSEDLRNFVELFSKKEDGNYIFDVYAKDSILNNLPDYVANCKESGGLVPVVDGAADIVPPQVVPIKDIDTSAYLDNYQQTLFSANESFPPYKNFLIKVDTQEVPAAAREIGIYNKMIKNTYYSYDVFYHLGSFYLKDRKDSTSYVYSTSVDAPLSTVIQNPTLQLGVLRFKVVDSWTVFTPVCKPAVYLYPEKETEVNVKVNPQGKLTGSIPEYDPKNGWNVKAYPDGTLIRLESDKDTSEVTRPPAGEAGRGSSDGGGIRVYPYLFYEADLKEGYKPQEGWVVEKESIKYQVSSIMQKIGFNTKEISDFLDYWLPRLNEKPYYYIGVV
ncbi:hypothetical protein HY945_00590, partial [Candidatus Gottesmanbacteria bacterium]|nr:hypothetical protein [Candidatus Gottesmanbacteria bacterium]